MRHIVLFGVAGVLVVVGLIAVAREPVSRALDDWGACLSGDSDRDRAIAACTEVISFGLWPSSMLAFAYFSRGNAYLAKGDADHAIVDYDDAIKRGPTVALFYHGRASVYLRTGDFRRAIADCDEAIRLGPIMGIVYVDRGEAYHGKGDEDRAIADFDEAIRLEPKYAWAYGQRGRAYLYRGDLPNALADFDREIVLAPKDGYAAIWRDIARQRAGLAGSLAEATAQVDMAKWPAPVARMLLGQLTPAEALAAADDPDPFKKRGQVCEANFYGGELALRQDMKEDATRLFEAVVEDCPKAYVEWRSAKLELVSLSAAR